ncbi:MAG: hypothetical protein E7021_04665 [Alphaproteobacteria bacterium]|nr:hypothetical protein [Alphaproteobacteria bacterium]
MSLNKFQTQLKKLPTIKRKFLLNKLMAYSICQKNENAASDYPDAKLVAIEKTDKALAQFILSSFYILDKGCNLSETESALKKNKKTPEEIISTRRGKYYQNIAVSYESELTQEEQKSFVQNVMTAKTVPDFSLLRKLHLQRSK